MNDRNFKLVLKNIYILNLNKIHINRHHNYYSYAGDILEVKRSFLNKFPNNGGMETRGGDTKNLSESLQDVTWN